MAIKHSKSIEEKILERLAEGELMTVLCRDEVMPSMRQLQRWRRDDAEFDDRCWSAEGQGLMVQPCLSGYHPHPLYVVCLLGLQARPGAGALRRRSG